jgi:hypothetical protein
MDRAVTELVTEAALIVAAVRESDILEHWFQRMYAAESFSGRFDGWALTMEARTLMNKRGYIKQTGSTRDSEKPPSGIDRGTFKLDGGDVVIDRYELKPAGIRAARALHT